MTIISKNTNKILIGIIAALTLVIIVLASALIITRNDKAELEYKLDNYRYYHRVVNDIVKDLPYNIQYVYFDNYKYRGAEGNLN